MPDFEVPFSSSSLPSTPGSQRQSRRDHAFISDTTNLSTTPAAPPPSTAKSFTPAGPPPSSIFGSSQPRNDAGPLGRARKSPRRRLDRSNGRHSPPQEDAALEIPVPDGMDLEFDSRFESPGRYRQQAEASDGASTHDWRPRKSALASSLLGDQPTSREPDTAVLPRLEDDPIADALEIRTIAKDIARQAGTAELQESSDFILETEELVSKLYPRHVRPDDYEAVVQVALDRTPGALCREWTSLSGKSANHTSGNGARVSRIGPADNDPPLQKALFVSTLLLPLHHPPARRSEVNTRAQGFLSRSLVPSGASEIEALPKVFFDWLDEHHDPFSLGLKTLRSQGSACTAHINYWDILLSNVLRGHVSDVAKILKMSDFANAQSAEEDDPGRCEYNDSELQSIDAAVRDAVRLLESCPIVHNGNYNMAGSHWRAFRARAFNAATALSVSVEGKGSSSFLPSISRPTSLQFGRSLSPPGRSNTSRSKLPWFIYQQLKTLYTLLAGESLDSINFAHDWLEGVLFLAVWYRGGNDSILQESGNTKLLTSRLGRSAVGHAQLADSPDSEQSEIYQLRLKNAFHFVVHQGGLHVNSNDPVEVGLACALEGDVQGVLGLLQAWSLPVASAVAEIASIGGWLPRPPSSAMDTGFDDSDLMVLSYAQSEPESSKDSILGEYAIALCRRKRLRSAKKSDTDGWEIALQLFCRLDDRSVASKRINLLLEQVDVGNNERADRLIGLCRDVGMGREATRIAEKYADSTAENTNHYGTALRYYAYSHRRRKVKDVLDLLISYCLVQSKAYPSRDDTDRDLRMLLHEPRKALSKMAKTDTEAAEILSTQLSGYATLRKFYELRDREGREGMAVASLAGKKDTIGPLFAVIASAADNIQGGLFDQTNPAVVPVEGLLVLLGEASVLLKDERRLLSLPQLTLLLRAVEDLQTVHPRIFAQCRECLASARAAARGARAADPRALLKQSISEVTASSRFSLVGSSMQDGSAASRDGGGDKAEETRRGWDWRQGVASGVEGEALLEELRAVIARTVADAWVSGEAM